MDVFEQNKCVQSCKEFPQVGCMSLKCGSSHLHVCSSHAAHGCLWPTNCNPMDLGEKSRIRGKKVKKSTPFSPPLPVAFLNCFKSPHKQELCHSLRKDKRTHSLHPHVHRRTHQPLPSAVRCHQLPQYRSRRGKGAWGSGCASMEQRAASVMLHAESAGTSALCWLVDLWIESFQLCEK